jgi:hypothetical protein
MVFGHGRIPIMNWMREKANEALIHAVEAGEEVTDIYLPEVGVRSVRGPRCTGSKAIICETPWPWPAFGRRHWAGRTYGYRFPGELGQEV